MMMVPIDLQAPKGRLILPQVQAIRDALDNDAAALVVKDREFTSILGRLREPPALVICDSQVVLKMVAETPADIRCSTFSILFRAIGATDRGRSWRFDRQITACWRQGFDRGSVLASRRSGRYRPGENPEMGPAIRRTGPPIRCLLRH